MFEIDIWHGNGRKELPPSNWVSKKKFLALSLYHWQKKACPAVALSFTIYSVNDYIFPAGNLNHCLFYRNNFTLELNAFFCTKKKEKKNSAKSIFLALTFKLIEKM